MAEVVGDKALDDVRSHDDVDTAGAVDVLAVVVGGEIAAVGVAGPSADGGVEPPDGQIVEVLPLLLLNWESKNRTVWPVKN